MSETVSATFSSFISSTRWSKMTLRWSFMHVVELQDVLADVEVARLDLLLRLLQRLVDPGMDDRLVLLQAELGQHAVELVGAEDAHQVVFERQEELRAARIALAAGAAAQLVVDAPALVALGAEHEQPAGLGHGLAGLSLAGAISTISSAFSAISRKRSMSALICSIASRFSASSVMSAVSCGCACRRCRRAGCRCRGRPCWSRW